MIHIKYLRRLLAVLLAVVICAAPAVAQETDNDDASATEGAAESAEATSSDADADADEEEIDVDDGSYLDGEDEDFRPSEEVSADRSITFPTDI